MDNNNPAEMSNEDLEKEMEQKNEEVKSEMNQENVKKTTASEGTLKSPSEDQHSVEKLSAESHDGSMPDPEELSTWESNDDDPNKISS